MVKAVWSTAWRGGVPENQRHKGLRGESPTPSSQQPLFITSVNSNSSKNSNHNGNKAAATS
ncbi:MAG: hypothetical protein RM347_016640 [Nostoc sp. ChiQUE02]|uniref:hypothetical protein n=1 Tax=Nostoc sp. ChiQUE02 TaxID=3075377 RepID=UPI002AD31473|nr:hypothetical protein [Nostoc sp. ChiQUE02]MDZ8229009.1 hypothetical protein [Nostoc sp. ChiQUE02]